MTETKEYTKIDWVNYDNNHIVSTKDIEATLLCPNGDVSELSDNVLKATLWLFGLDTHKPYEKLQLPEGASHRSLITDIVQTEGVVYSGRLRTDPHWKKKGVQITIDYLFGDKHKEVLKLIKGDVNV